MRLGLQVPDFTWPGGAAELGPTLARIARAGDAAGFDVISVMDHFFQIRSLGPPEHEMLEGYTALGFIAAHTSRARLMTLVTGVHYRHPGILAKTVTTLDVLSGGRAWLGIGAGWNEEESRGLGVPFPNQRERFERLEETLRICRQMWAGDETPFAGRHFQLERLLNSPPSVSRPRPGILVGGSGPRRTMRLVAQYADACNLVPGPELPTALEALRRHCDELGRDYASIEKTAIFRFDPGVRGENAEDLLSQLRWLASLGIETVIGSVPGVEEIWPLEVMGERVIPAAAEIEAAAV